MRLLDYAKLFVIEYIPPTIMAFILGFTLSYMFNTSVIKLLFGIISTILIVFGYNTFNGVYDKKIDKINKPERPIPKGVITDKNAIYLSLAFFVISIIISSFLNTIFLICMLITVLFSILYSYPPFYLKKHFLSGTILGTSMYAILFPLAGWSLGVGTSLPWQIILFLFIFGLGIGLLKDFEDIKGDKKYGIRTAPIALGYAKAILLSILLFVISFLILLFFVLTNAITIYYLIIIVFILWAIFIAYKIFKEQKKHISKKLFKNAMAVLTIMEILIIIINIFLFFGIKL